MIFTFLLTLTTATEYYFRQIDRAYIEIYQLNECLFEDTDNYIKITKTAENAEILYKNIFKDENCSRSHYEQEIPLDNQYEYVSSSLQTMEIFSVIQPNCKETYEKPKIIRFYPTECSKGKDNNYKYVVIDNYVIQREEYDLDDFDCRRDPSINDDMEYCECKVIENNDYVEAFTCNVKSFSSNAPNDNNNDINSFNFNDDDMSEDEK